MTDLETLATPAPREEWVTRVVYLTQPDQASAEVMALTAHDGRLAEKRRADHLACGAAEAGVYRRTWTPSSWERVS